MQIVNNRCMSVIINVILCALAIFALGFIWIYLALNSLYAALTLSALLAACTGYIVWLALARAEKNKKRKRARKKSVADFAEHIRFDADNGNAFADMLRYYRFEILQKNCDSLTVCKNNVKTYVAICFAADTLTKEELRCAVIQAKRAQCDKLIIFCEKADTYQKETANRRIATQICDAENTYALFEESGKLPAIIPRKARTNGIVAKYAFNRKRFGWYMASGVFMLLTAAIAYFKWYALIWATVMFALAIYSLINKKYNTLPTNITLD